LLIRILFIIFESIHHYFASKNALTCRQLNITFFTMSFKVTTSQLFMSRAFSRQSFIGAIMKECSCFRS